MIIVKLLTMALIGALIGYMTNVIAIKLLFRPLEPYKILNFSIQGLIPKRREEIIESVANTVETELIDIDVVFDQILETMDKKAVLELLEAKISKAIVDNLPPLMAAFSGSVTSYIHEFLEKEGDKLLTEITEELVHRATDKISIKDLVKERLITYDLIKIENIILDLARTELKQIENLGAVLGFIVGILQGLLVIFVF